jgi:biopolymer transport protein ExbD
MAGGGGSRTDDGKKKARIEIIPLIDVIFFLLATFVLFTLSLDRIRSVPVNLPVPSPTQEQLKDDTSVTIQVSDQNTCYWSSGSTPGAAAELINVSEIEPRIRQYKANTAEPRILIAGDEKAKFGVTIQILDEVRKAGITQVSVETRTRVTGH